MRKRKINAVIVEAWSIYLILPEIILIYGKQISRYLPYGIISVIQRIYYSKYLSKLEIAVKILRPSY